MPAEEVEHAPLYHEGNDFGTLEFNDPIQPLFIAIKYGGEGGIRTHVPVTRQDAFEAPPLRPLRYLSGRCSMR